MLLVMISSLAVLVIFAVTAVMLVRPQGPNAKLSLHAMRAAAAAIRIDETDPASRHAILEEIRADYPDLKLNLSHTMAHDQMVERLPPFWPLAPGRVNQNVEFLGVLMHADKTGEARKSLEEAEDSGEAPQLVFRLSDGTLVESDMLPRDRPPILGDPLFQLLIFLVISVTMLLVWAMRTLVRPLSDLSQAVTSFGENTTILAPLAARGPQEVRDAALAFNRMQQRIHDLIERRTQMLAAISHDLRTPLTRLRLRLELIEDAGQRTKSLADLKVMEAQIDGALTFLKQGRTGEVSVCIDLPSLLKGIQDEYEDAGQMIGLEAEGDIKVFARPSELVRAIENLTGNALRYGAEGTVTVRLTSRDGKACIDVVDHGPGIGATEKERMLLPFVRGDSARSIGSEAGTGFGLGLATTLSIVEAHGGALELLDTPGGGLTARILLPLVAAVPE
jgi:signal transduction histidine kinase